MKLYTATCPDCGWTSKPTKTPGLAEYASRRHSCDKQRADAERRALAAARRAEREAAVDRTPKPCLHKRAEHQHGTHACYVLDKCRCQPCADATSTYERNRVRRNAYGRADLVDAEPVRAHVRALMAAGLGLKQIAARAGIRGGGNITKLIYGIPGRRPPVKRVRKDTAARYLAVPIPAPTDLAGGARIPSLGTRRRLQALAVLGWSIGALATRYDLDRQRLDNAMHGDEITVATAHLVARIYDDLWDVPAPETSHRERIVASRIRNRAAANRWAPPLAWDDIDDPDERPTTGRKERGIDLDDVDHLLAYGLTPDRVTERIGRSWEAIMLAARREGRDDVQRRLARARDAA